MILYIIGFIVAIISFLYIGITFGRKQERDRLAPQLQQMRSLDEEIVKRNKQEEQRSHELKDMIAQLETKKTAIIESITSLQEQADEVATSYEKKALEVAQLKIESSLTEEGIKFESAIQDYKNEYLGIMQEISSNINEQIQQKTEELNKVNAEIQNIKATREALIQANLREQESLDTIAYHSIQLSEHDIIDIATLDRIKEQLFKPEILSKLIWSTYFLQPVNILCNKVFGANKVCGIYKITNIQTREVYIGQSVDCAERTKQHVKAGLGIDNKGTNKLYKAMQRDGVWHFMFELLEECPRDELDKKEKKYIAIYESDKFGYNSTKGNS